MKFYKLTEEGISKCESYLAEMKAKRKEILDARKDTADETSIDLSLEDLLYDALSFGIDEYGLAYNSWGVTDNYNMDYPLCLELDVDFYVYLDTSIKNKTAGEVYNEAVEYSFSQEMFSYGEIAEITSYFEELGTKFGLLDEFHENGIC